MQLFSSDTTTWAYNFSTDIFNIFLLRQKHEKTGLNFFSVVPTGPKSTKSHIMFHKNGATLVYHLKNMIPSGLPLI